MEIEHGRLPNLPPSAQHIGFHLIFASPGVIRSGLRSLEIYFKTIHATADFPTKWGKLDSSLARALSVKAICLSKAHGETIMKDALCLEKSSFFT